MRSVRLRGGDAIDGVLAGDGHEHRVAAAIDADFDGIDVELRHQFLEIGEHTGGESFARVFVEQRGALSFAQRRVEREDVVFLFVAGLIANGPVGDDEIGEGVAGAPVVVAAIVDGLVEDDVDDGIGREARAVHGGFLCVGETRARGAR